MESEWESEELSFDTYFHSAFFSCLALFLPVHTVPCLTPGLPIALRWVGPLTFTPPGPPLPIALSTKLSP